MRRNNFTYLLGSGGGDTARDCSETKGQSSSSEDPHVCSSISRQLGQLILGPDSFAQTMGHFLDATDWHGSWLHVPCLHIDLPSRGLWNRPVQLSPQWPLGREVFFSWFPHPLIYQRLVTQLAMDGTIALAFIYSHLENFKQIYILHPKKSIY